VNIASLPDKTIRVISENIKETTLFMLLVLFISTSIVRIPFSDKFEVNVENQFADFDQTESNDYLHDDDTEDHETNIFASNSSSFSFDTTNGVFVKVKFLFSCFYGRLEYGIKSPPPQL
jgi:hypothetical protein